MNFTRVDFTAASYISIYLFKYHISKIIVFVAGIKSLSFQSVDR